jgi:thioredoxin 1
VEGQTVSTVKNVPPVEWGMSTAQPGEPIHVESGEHLDELVAEHDVVLVDFHADWCGPCKMLEPTVEEIAAETDVAVLKIDIDELQDVAREAGVRSVPTLQFYKGGEEAKRVIGVQDKDDFLDVIAELS